MASVSAEADASLRSIPIIAVTSYALNGETETLQPARTAGEDSPVHAQNRSRSIELASLAIDDREPKRIKRTSNYFRKCALSEEIQCL